MSELSRVEDLLKTGVEEPVLPMSRLEAILRGEKITPQSRVEELLLQYNPSDILIEKRITANGTYFAVNDNADGYFKVVVDTPVVPPTVLDHLVETITENGTYTYTPEHDGFEDTEITVNVQPSVGTKSITANGTYNVSDEVESVIRALSYTNISANSFGHNTDDIREKGFDVQYLKILRIYCRASGSQDDQYVVEVSDIPTFTPTQLSDKENMYLVASYESDTKQLYVSKDESGFWILLVGDILFSRNKLQAIWNIPRGWVGYSQVTVNVSGGADDHIYLMDGQVPGNQGTTYLEFDKAPINGYYVISIYANNKSINHMVYFETGRNSDSFNFSPGSSGSYNCYIMWDNNKATLRVACNSGSWYAMHARVTRVDNNYILNS